MPPPDSIEGQGLTDIGVADVLQMPGVHIGTTDEIAATARERRRRHGFSHLMVDDSQLDSFAPVVAALKGR